MLPDPHTVTEAAEVAGKSQCGTLCHSVSHCTRYATQVTTPAVHGADKPPRWHHAALAVGAYALAGPGRTADGFGLTAI